MTRQEAIAEAPAEAVVLYTKGCGKSWFFGRGDNFMSTNLKEIPFDDNRKPVFGGEFIAYKKSDSKWYWYENRDEQATKLLESMGYVWNYENQIWDAP